MKQLAINSFRKQFSLLLFLSSTVFMVSCESEESDFSPTDDELVIAQSLLESLDAMGLASNWNRTYNPYEVFDGESGEPNMNYINSYVDTTNWTSADQFLQLHAEYFQALYDLQTEVTYVGDAEKMKLLFSEAAVKTPKSQQNKKYYISCAGQCLDNREKCRAHAATEISLLLSGCAIGGAAIASLEFCVASLRG
ncbi:hypothetical protein [Neolewinella sp.]|uniref:hypothetical protein n=1 Tax=Neolewinella sp. TaxID=2993543 RepID=UPI003B51DF1D